VIKLYDDRSAVVEFGWAEAKLSGDCRREIDPGDAMTDALSLDLLGKMPAWVGQIYLHDNPLLEDWPYP
jgi:hypothetical protein